MTLSLRAVAHPIPASVQEDALLPVYSLLARVKTDVPIDKDGYKAGCCLLIMGVHLAKVAGDHTGLLKQKMATEAWLHAGQRHLRSKGSRLKLSARQRQQVIDGLAAWERVLPKVDMPDMVEAAQSWKQYERAAGSDDRALGFVERLVER